MAHGNSQTCRIGPRARLNRVEQLERDEQAAARTRLARYIRRQTRDGQELVDFATGVLRDPTASVDDRRRAADFLERWGAPWPSPRAG